MSGNWLKINNKITHGLILIFYTLISNPINNYLNNIQYQIGMELNSRIFNDPK